MHIKLILNMFSARQKFEKPSVFLVRGRVLMVLCRLFMLRISIVKTPCSLCLRVHYITNSAKMKCFLPKSIDSTKMN